MRGGRVPTSAGTARWENRTVPDEGIPHFPARPARPVWWWFALHGLLAIAFGVFTLLTPFTDEPGYLIDAHAFAILALLAGAELGILGFLSRGTRGWVVLLVAGAHAAAASVLFWVLAALGQAHALLWSSFGFLVVEGALLLVGLLRSSSYRLWGILLGACLMAAAAIMLTSWLADPEHSFDLPDAAMGVAALLYGVAVFVAALQARGTGLGGAPR